MRNPSARAAAMPARSRTPVLFASSSLSVSYCCVSSSDALRCPLRRSSHTSSPPPFFSTSSFPCSVAHACDPSGFLFNARSPFFSSDAAGSALRFRTLLRRSCSVSAVSSTRTTRSRAAERRRCRRAQRSASPLRSIGESAPRALRGHSRLFYGKRRAHEWLGAGARARARAFENCRAPAVLRLSALTLTLCALASC
eukprot:6209077-Pleurochrysis_carterae.AAC.7